MAVVNNKVFILPCAVDWYGEGRWLLNPFREEIIKSVLKEAVQAGDAALAEQVIFTVDAPYVTPYYYEADGRKTLILVNSSNDDIDELRIFAPGWKTDGVTDSVVEINRYAPGGVPAAIVGRGECMIYSGGLKSMEMKALVWG
jgi:hypothetical protein